MANTSNTPFWTCLTCLACLIWVGGAPNTSNTPRRACSTCLRGDVGWERCQTQKHTHLGLFSCSAGVVGLGHEWMGGRGTKHIEHAQTGVFEGGREVEEVPSM